MVKQRYMLDRQQMETPGHASRFCLSSLPSRRSFSKRTVVLPMIKILSDAARVCSLSVSERLGTAALGADCRAGSFVSCRLSLRRSEVYYRTGYQDPPHRGRVLR